MRKVILLGVISVPVYALVSITMRHYHLALVPDNAPRPGPAIAGAAAMADPFSVDCVQLGGGGIREKLIRLVVAKRLSDFNQKCI